MQLGWIFFAVHVLGWLAYGVFRAIYTLHVAYVPYAVLVLFAELLWGSRALLYILASPELGSKEADIYSSTSERTTSLPYCVRVLLYCRGEEVSVVERVVQAVLEAGLPNDSTRHVYLVDSAGDASLKAWVEGLGRSGGVRYLPVVTGRGKKAVCLNKALQKVYKTNDGQGASCKEIVTVLHCDQAVHTHFFESQLSGFRDHQALFSPQAVLSSGHRHRNESGGYERIALDSTERRDSYVDKWCNGMELETNYLVCKDTLMAVGSFDEHCEREDYSLYLTMKAAGKNVEIGRTCLAVQEGTREAAGLYASRRQWSKCHLHLFFSRRNILFSRGTSIHEKLRHTVAPWMQLTSAICTPIFILAPIIAILFGVYPAKSSSMLLYGFGVFYILVLLDFAIGINTKHTLSIQLANGYDIVLWNAHLLSVIEILVKKICCCCCCGESSPSPVKKKGKYSPQRDPEKGVPSSGGTISWIQWIPVLLGIVFSIASIIAGVVMIMSNHKVLPIPSDVRLAMMAFIVWAAYNTLTMIFYAYHVSSEQTKPQKYMVWGGIAPVLFIGAMVGVALCSSKISYDFGEVLSKSLLFYEAQRSGKLPENNRIPWRGDSALHDVTQDDKSLAGGYYDAGDFVKFGLPLGETLTLLSWSIVEFSDNYRTAGELEHARSAVRWGTDYLLKCHTKKNEFYAQVGLPKEEHSKWGRPEDLFEEVKRVGQPINETHPGSDIAGASAAALAAAHLVFKEVDEPYSKELLQHARDLYEFGTSFVGFAKDHLLECREFYDSQEYLDDLAMGAIWLYKATGEKPYVKQSMKYLDEMIKKANGTMSEYFGWDNQGAGVAVLLAVETLNSTYLGYVDSHFKKWVYSLKYNIQGFSYLTQWGALRFDANTAFLSLVHAKHVLKHKVPGFHSLGESVYHCWALAQIRRMLGDSGRSFVAGYGHNPPEYLHHRAASCPDMPAPCNWDNYRSPLPNPQILYGALVGGPFENGSYTDARSNYRQNEPALDYNAGFTASLAGLVTLSHGTGMCHNGAGFYQWIRRDRKFW